ncbi:hypothetical protein ACIRS1_01830 [Kitasatospora sp. NPDC101176]|uniref:hypothetical protein n=1 Tax=Kitasatospora sp. NPDC101176 TaxID=3364099 RepID=UPI0038091FB1
MTVLHSRNADAADPADVAAADVKDPQDAKATTAEPDLREDLGRYAELGAFTLTADTHAWYAAVDTVATPEDARAGSTALAELRGHDLQQTWDDVTALASEAKLDEPDTVAKTVLLVELLQRVHRTAATLHRAAYDADLGALAAATADGAWRRENGVKLSWLRARSLRKQATALATDRRVRREDLHEALTSAEIERRAWAALAPSGTLPAAPADGALVDRTAQTFESINAGLRELARLLPGHDLDGLAFAELIDLVDRLAADEGTLYRLPTIRGLRATLEDAGLADLLSELAATRADRYAAEAAYAARQALAGGQRDGLAGGTAAGTVESDTVESDTAGSEVVGSEVVGSEVVESVESAEPESAESSTAPVSVEEPSTDVVAEVATEADAEIETEAEVAAETVAVEAEPSEETDVHEAVAAEEVTVEAQPVVVTLPAPSPAADDLVAAATASLAEAPDVPEALEEPETAEPVATDEPVEEAVEEAPEVEAVAEAPAVEEPAVVASEPAVEAEAVAEPEAVEETVDPVEEAAPIAEAEAEVAEAPEAEAAVEVAVEEPAAEAEVTEQPVVVETVEAEVVAEVATETEVVDETVEPVAVEEPEAEVAAEPVVVETVEAEIVAEVVTEAEVVAEVEVVDETVEPVAVEEPEVEVVEVETETETPAAVVEEAAEPVALEEPAVQEQAAEPVKEPEPELEPAPVAAGRPAKPDFTPGRPVTAYSADELLAVVRWVDGDGETRSEEELLRAAMKELGFARLGPRIKEALGAAVTAARG